jgi:hypothetical protein
VRSVKRSGLADFAEMTPHRRYRPKPLRHLSRRSLGTDHGELDTVSTTFPSPESGRYSYPDRRPVSRKGRSWRGAAGERSETTSRQRAIRRQSLGQVPASRDTTRGRPWPRRNSDRHSSVGSSERSGTSGVTQSGIPLYSALGRPLTKRTSSGARPNYGHPRARRYRRPSSRRVKAPGVASR